MPKPPNSNDSSLFPKKIVQQLESAGREHHSDKLPLVKLTAPWSTDTWLINMAFPSNPDVLFGIADDGAHPPRLGCFSRTHLEHKRGPGPYGTMSLERDQGFTPRGSLMDYWVVADNNQRLSFDLPLGEVWTQVERAFGVTIRIVSDNVIDCLGLSSNTSGQARALYEALRSAQNDINRIVEQDQKACNDEGKWSALHINVHVSALGSVEFCPVFDETRKSKEPSFPNCFRELFEDYLHEAGHPDNVKLFCCECGSSLFSEKHHVACTRNDDLV